MICSCPDRVLLDVLSSPDSVANCRHDTGLAQSEMSLKQALKTFG
jgi:hypothetical protein